MPSKPTQILVHSLKQTQRKLDEYQFPQKSVNLLDHSTAISYDQGNETCKDLIDRTAFSHEYAQDLVNIAELQQLIKESQTFIHMLYTYRSVKSTEILI